MSFAVDQRLAPRTTSLSELPRQSPIQISFALSSPESMLERFCRRTFVHCNLNYASTTPLACASRRLKTAVANRILHMVSRQENLRNLGDKLRSFGDRRNFRRGGHRSLCSTIDELVLVARG